MYIKRGQCRRWHDLNIAMSCDTSQIPKTKEKNNAIISMIKLCVNTLINLQLPVRFKDFDKNIT